MEMDRKMKFGVEEIREFTRSHSDERIVIIGQRLEECRSKNSKWCDRVAVLESAMKEIQDEIDREKAMAPKLIRIQTIMRLAGC